jgi:hypothetical protein
MCTTSQSNEWERIVAKIGLLTLTAGLLEAAVMAMHCKATNQSEAELKSRLNEPQRKGLKKAVKSLDWPDDKKDDLSKRLSEIAALDKRRNDFVHVAAGFVSNNSIQGIPAGSAIDLRTYGVGVTNSEGNSARLNEDQRKSFDWPDEKAALSEQLSAIAAFEDKQTALIQAGQVRSLTIGAVAKTIDLNEIDKLIDDLSQARLGLVPYMELVDKITHPPKSAAEFFDRLKKGKPL